ncbi:MAG: hypothetical protein F2631_05170 [Actinobacteria bacterium]|nr:hypothetical protein [Actinomycetota bacterium]
MRRRNLSLVGLVLCMIFHSSAPSFASEDATTINNEISILQAQVMRDTEIASTERMMIANMERNILGAQESIQRWNQQLSNESDPQRRSYFQDQIDGWNRWISTDMANESGQRYQTLNTALTNILENQRKISEAESRLVALVQSSLVNPEVTPEQQAQNLQELNAALENRINVDLFTTQRQIFAINALNTQMGMLNPNSELYRSLDGAKRNLQVVLDKTSESYVLKNQILASQKAALEDLKSIQASASTPALNEEKLIENVSEITSNLNAEVKENSEQIARIELAIKDLTEKMNTFSKSDPTYDQTLVSIDVLKNALNELMKSKESLALISKANDDLIESVKDDTVVDRFVNQLTEVAGSDESNPNSTVLKVSKQKKGKFIANLSFENDQTDPFALETEELKEISLTLKSNKREFKLSLTRIKEDVTQWTFDKRPVKGTYKLIVAHAESDDVITISAKVELK